ncbi:unnamed protein product [Caenorhabditis auriculariae]|uniref:Uncharacterized protein n=1 Tax=Caenorhabditis auriculariae TaxID=2777116 RepID=A0A8S1GXB1_9PELO|nr:unnamed protein product [Caenorhabditis auriculariae]
MKRGSSHSYQSWRGSTGEGYSRGRGFRGRWRGDNNSDRGRGQRGGFGSTAPDYSSPYQPSSEPSAERRGWHPRGQQRVFRAPFDQNHGRRFNARSRGRGGGFHGNRENSKSYNVSDYVMPSMWANPWEALDAEYAKDLQDAREAFKAQENNLL